MLHQGGGFPPDQLAKYRERKQLIDQIVAKDAEEMKRTIDVSMHCVYMYNTLHCMDLIKIKIFLVLKVFHECELFV